jgi:site-specific DNA-cytosine methylase
MNHLSLFSGIGGFDLAAEWIGWENIGQVEKDQFCLQVLNKNFPDVPKPPQKWSFYQALLSVAISGAFLYWGGFFSN